MEKLRKLRTRKNVSQEKLAIEIGVTQRHIAFIESGERNPSLALALKLAIYFNVKVEDIFSLANCT